MTEVLLAVTIAVALVYTFASGLQDASNAVSTAIATRSLEPRVATVAAAGMAFAGTVAGWWLAPVVADQTGLGAATITGGDAGLGVLAVLVACSAGWLLVMARAGMPVSSTHTLVAALVGAAATTGGEIRWGELGTDVLLPMTLSTAGALVLTYVATRVARRLAMSTDASQVEPTARVVQAAASTASAMFIGLVGSAKSVVLLMTALALSGRSSDDVPAWVVLAAGVALAAGMAFGGRRVIATLGELMVGHAAVRGASIQGAAVLVFAVGALAPGLPISTTHTIGAAMIGSGLVTPGRMRWRTARNVVVAWLVTLPAVAACAALLGGITHMLLTHV
ncbi:MAG: inorganic phosphate transporter [Actinomycetales bacterium]